MICKKEPHEKCMCLKRKHGGCSECEKNAIKTVRDHGRNLNEDIKIVKETGQTLHDLYIGVYGISGDPMEFAWRSAIDILRAVCDYCKHSNSPVCDKCMWSNEANREDHWTFNEVVLSEEP
jgi:hypothetical protein